MPDADDVLRAQARALIRVLVHYKLHRIGDGAQTLLWRSIEAYGTSSGDSRDLHTIHRDFYNLALAGSSIGLKHKAANAALFLALHTFCGSNDEYRFRVPAWWIAVAITWHNKKPVPDAEVQGEVLEQLDAAFDVEISAISGACMNDTMYETPPLTRAGRRAADAALEAAKFRPTPDGKRLVRRYDVHGMVVTEYVSPEQAAVPI